MAKRWSVAGLLLAAGLMSGHALAVALDLDKPFKPQAAQVRADLADGEKYSRSVRMSALRWALRLIGSRQRSRRSQISGHCSQSNWRRFATIRSSSPEF